MVISQCGFQAGHKGWKIRLEVVADQAQFEDIQSSLSGLIFANERLRFSQQFSQLFLTES
jgi:hypothetical protein